MKDLESIGRIGLWKACTSYKSEKGMFSTYAVDCIKKRNLHRVKQV